MNRLRVLRALLRKDLGVHRPVLILGGVLLVVPYLGALLGYLLSSRESRATWHLADVLTAMSSTSLVLSLLTVVGLAGSAFAAERESRASELLGRLPTPRWLILCSKVTLTTAAVVLITLVNVAPLVALKPHLVGSPESRSLFEIPRLLVPVAVLLFGAAWLASAWLRQSTVASVCGLAAPVLVAAAVQGFRLTLVTAPFEFGSVFQGVCLMTGLLAFVAGCAVYLVRFEP